MHRLLINARIMARRHHRGLAEMPIFFMNADGALGTMRQLVRAELKGVYARCPDLGGCPSTLLRGGPDSHAPCGMRHPSPAARAIRNSPAPRTAAPMARATRSPAGARRSTV